MAYNSGNSLTPMMFKKQKKSDKGGTRNERLRSRSVENILETPNYNRSPGAGAQLPVTCAPGQQWKEVYLVKHDHPVVACVLPSLAMDFVASALLATGATPLITEG